jgi:hypothetical protein
VTLLHAAPVGRDRPLDGIRRRLSPFSQLRGGLGPSFAVAWKAVRSELCAERDERSEVGHILHGPRLGDAHEPVGVEVVPEQQAGVVVARREQARAAVVQEVALVDRLEPERVALVRERREDGLQVALRLRPQSLRPEPALDSRIARDGVPDVGRYSQPASSFVQYETIRSAPARTIAVSDSSAACRSSSQPRAPAAFSIAYSPETL